MEPNYNSHRIRPADVDAISGATPKGQTHTIEWVIPESYFQKRVTLYLEANVAFDYNE